MEDRKKMRKDAKCELVQWKAMRELAKDNHYASHIMIGGFNKGVCLNKKLLPAINHNIRELKRFLAGKKNKWE